MRYPILRSNSKLSFASQEHIRECVRDANDGDQQLAIPEWTVALGSEWLTVRC
jgi:hypothetical protein